MRFKSIEIKFAYIYTLPTKLFLKWIYFEWYWNKHLIEFLIKNALIYLHLMVSFHTMAADETLELVDSHLEAKLSLEASFWMSKKSVLIIIIDWGTSTNSLTKSKRSKTIGDIWKNIKSFSLRYSVLPPIQMSFGMFLPTNALKSFVLSIIT